MQIQRYTPDYILVPFSRFANITVVEAFEQLKTDHIRGQRRYNAFGYVYQVRESNTLKVDTIDHDILDPEILHAFVQDVFTNMETVEDYIVFDLRKIELDKITIMMAAVGEDNFKILCTDMYHVRYIDGDNERNMSVLVVTGC